MLNEHNTRIQTLFWQTFRELNEDNLPLCVHNTTHTYATNYENNFNFNDLLVYTTGGTNSSKLNIKIGYNNNKNCHQGKW